MTDCLLKVERLKRGWTQAALSAKCGCVPSAIANIECGIRMPSLTLAVALAGALDVSLAALATSCIACCEVRKLGLKQEVANAIVADE